MEQIAEIFGVAPKTIVEWQKQGMPVALRGQPGVPSEYESDLCIQWLVDREIHKLRKETPADRLARVKADAIEMDNAERRGQLIPADQLEPKLRSAMVLAREKWLDAYPRIARQVQGKSPEDAEALLRAEFEGFLRRIANWRQAEDDIDSEADDAK
jgi:hypothetical protein